MPDLESIFAKNPFAGDTGNIAPELERAFAEPSFLKTEAVVEALSNVRVLIGAAPHSDPGRDANGNISKHEVSAGPLSNPEGFIRVAVAHNRNAYAIFSSADTYASFTANDNAARNVRPVPVMARDIAALALTRADGLLVLDPGTSNQHWIGRSACAAIATGEEWVAPWDDPEIAAHIMGSLEGNTPGLERVSVDPAEGGGVILTLHFVMGSTPEQVAHAVRAVSHSVGAQPYVKARLDVVELRPFWGGV